MVDVGVVFTENIIRHIELPQNVGKKGKQLLQVVYEGTIEVAGAVVTALMTTIISFLPVFAMEAAEGKLFRPLAFTKTFAMLAALLIGLVLIPTFAHVVFSIKYNKTKSKLVWNGLLVLAGLVLSIWSSNYVALALTAFGINGLLADRWPEHRKNWVNYINIAITLMVVIFFLTPGMDATRGPKFIVYQLLVCHPHRYRCSRISDVGCTLLPTQSYNGV